MGAFIVAGLIFIATILLCLLQLFAAGMASSGTHESGAGITFTIGVSVALLVAATHWLPRIGW